MKPLYSIKIWEYIIVSVTLLILVLIFHETNIDRTLVSPFFSNLEPHWPWRNAFVTEKLLHKGGVKFIGIIVLTLIALRLFNKKIKENQRYRIFIYHTLLSASCSIYIIYLMKKNTPILCPWYLKEFGGGSDFVSITQIFDQTLPIMKCFPAGHSSAGYAWICIYFSYQLISGNQKRSLLLPGLFLGLIYGVTQQMRGAHFVSHDIATLLITWLVAGGSAILFKKIINIKKNEQ